jgi:hypothetical protein
LKADFRRFYHIADWNNELDAPTFFSLAARTIAYGGVMSARAMKEQKDTPSEPEAIANVTAQRADPVLSDIIEWAQ